MDELFFWGHDVHKPHETKFLRFMEIGRYLKNQDAIFYLLFKNIMFREYKQFEDFSAAYKELDSLSIKHHWNSMLFKSVLDVYYFPEKRHAAIATIINLATSSTKVQIPRMIKTFKTITRAIYPDTMFDQILSPPICNKCNTLEEKHYNPDGMPIYIHEIDNYSCNDCKVAVIFACLT